MRRDEGLAIRTLVETIYRPYDRPVVVASVCGTAGDPQGYESQCAKLTAAGLLRRIVEGGQPRVEVASEMLEKALAKDV